MNNKGELIAGIMFGSLLTIALIVTYEIMHDRKRK